MKDVFCDKIISMNHKLKIILTILILLVGIFQSANAFEFNKANFFTSIQTITEEAGNFLTLFSENTIGKVRNSFCKNYFDSLSSEKWYEGELILKIESKICNETIALKIDSKIKEVTTTQQKEKTNASTTEIKKIENPILKNTEIPQKQTETITPIVGEINLENIKVDLNEIVNLTNIERKKVNLKSLEENAILNTIALLRVRDMFEKGYFEHVSPTGESASVLANKLGYKNIVIGENIAIGNYDNANSLINAWMASEGHKNNILNINYTEIGVASMESDYKNQKVWISAQVFGRPIADCSAPNPLDKTEIESNNSSLKEKEELAKRLMEEIKSINKTSSPNFYNLKVSEYNSLVYSINTLIGETKKIIEKYNSTVTTYNECIKLK